MGNDSQSLFAVVMQELFKLGVYKKSQGRIARQVTCAVVWVAAAVLAWRIWILLGAGSQWRYLICSVLSWPGYGLDIVW